MRHTWGSPEPFSVTDVYRDWFDHVYKPGSDGAMAYDICLVKVADPVAANLEWLRDQATGQEADFLIDAQEVARISATLDDLPAWAPDVFLHRRRDVPDFAAKFRERFTLIPAGAARPDLPRPSRPAAALDPIIAVIDDGIGYLNARFCRASDGGLQTRLHRIWLQAEGEVEADHMVCGAEIGATEIDALLAKGSKLDEGAEYMASNIALHGHRRSSVWHGLADGPGTELSITHGTHVMDIAGGSDPLAPDGIASCPLLAVQLPPQTVEDTSGSKLQPYIVRAVRWIIDQARTLDVDGVARPLIINLSVGVVAGAKDGTSLLERQIAAELLRREAATGAPTRMVLAFGNDNLTRQVGHMTLTQAAAPLTLRVQSEDYTPSFVELRPDRPDDLQLAVDGLLSAPLPLGQLSAGEMVSLSGPNGSVARVYSIAAEPLDGEGSTQPWYLLALAPTATFEAGKPLAPSGAWTLRLATAGADQDCRIEVQRDDRALGFGPLARQSYLDDQELWQWKEPIRSPYAPPADGPVTRRGTHSSYISAEVPDQVWTVGAALSDTGFAAPYSATGAPWAAPTPGTSAVGDSSWILRGVMASGTLSGTTAVISGTSVAAPQITRELAAFYQTGPNAGPWRKPGKTRAKETKWFKSLQWSFEPGFDLDRLGPISVSREAGLRPRLDNGFA
ncbi:MAG: S8 family serine peptidase [Pseudomonadota bacterium]